LTFRVFLHPKAARFLEKAGPPLRRKIKEELSRLAESPEVKGERLTNSPFWKIRIGDHRAIYQIDNEHSKIIVLFIGHRKHVYDEFSRLL
jgi:mRNA interferase RelE/StbE